MQYSCGFKTLQFSNNLNTRGGGINTTFKEMAREAATLAHPHWRDAKYNNVVSSAHVIRSIEQDGDR